VRGPPGADEAAERRRRSAPCAGRRRPLERRSWSAGMWRSLRCHWCTIS